MGVAETWNVRFPEACRQLLVSMGVAETWNVRFSRNAGNFLSLYGGG